MAINLGIRPKTRADLTTILFVQAWCYSLEGQHELSRELMYCALRNASTNWAVNDVVLDSVRYYDA